MSFWNVSVGIAASAVSMRGPEVFTVLAVDEMMLRSLTDYKKSILYNLLRVEFEPTPFGFHAEDLSHCTARHFFCVTLFRYQLLQST
jgi:hypothetical protein